MKISQKEINRLKFLSGIITEAEQPTPSGQPAPSQVPSQVPAQAETPQTKELEQIVNLPVAEFVAKFKTIASDPKVQAVIKAGQTDGKPGDESVTFASANLPATQLIPTQNIIGQEESLMNILDDKYGSLNGFLSGQAKFPSPIITLNGKYIIDGHHRWSQAYAANPSVKIPAYDMKANITPEMALKAVQIAIAASVGNLPLSNAKGVNMLTAAEGVIKDIVIKNLAPNALAIYTKYGKGKTNEEVANYIWTNVNQLQTSNKPIPGAPDRSAMPQTDNAPGYADLLKKGVVNFIAPKSTDSQTVVKENFESFIKSEIRKTMKKRFNENYASASDFSNMWYSDLQGIDKLPKYPKSFINWLNEEDTWAQTYVLKMRIKKLIDLFDLWVNEKY